MKTVLIWVGVFAGTALILLGLGYLQNRSEQPVTNDEVTKILDTDQVKGDRNSKVVLVEYGDYQCPGCAAFEPLVEQVIGELGSQFAFVFRDFPLRNAHEFAQPAAEFAQAAGLQGKFWEMHDLLYKNQTAWSTKGVDAKALFLQYATSLALDVDKLKTDMKSDAIKDVIDRNLDGGLEYGINSTPTFYLNGLKLSPRNYDEFKSAVVDAIAKTQ